MADIPFRLNRVYVTSTTGTAPKTIVSEAMSTFFGAIATMATNDYWEAYVHMSVVALAPTASGARAQKQLAIVHGRKGVSTATISLPVSAGYRDSTYCKIGGFGDTHYVLDVPTGSGASFIVNLLPQLNVPQRYRLELNIEIMSSSFS